MVHSGGGIGHSRSAVAPAPDTEFNDLSQEMINESKKLNRDLKNASRKLQAIQRERNRASAKLESARNSVRRKLETHRRKIASAPERERVRRTNIAPILEEIRKVHVNSANTLQDANIKQEQAARAMSREIERTSALVAKSQKIIEKAGKKMKKSRKMKNAGKMKKSRKKIYK